MSYTEAPPEIRDAVEQLIRTYGSDTALLAGAMVAATVKAITAARVAEREACAETVDTLASVISDEIAAGGSPMQIMALSTQRHAVLTASAAIRDRSQL